MATCDKFMSLVLHCVRCAVIFALSGAVLHQDLNVTTSTAPTARLLSHNDTVGSPEETGLRKSLTVHDIFEIEEEDGGNLSSYLTKHDLMNNISCPPLESLHFLFYNKNNKTEVQELEKKWPCELRIYWKSPNVQGLVSVVRFLFNSVTIVMIVIGLLVNIYALFVLNSPPINKSNMSVYLKALALSDIGALLFSVTVGVLRARSTLINNVYLNQPWMCLLHATLRSVFFYYSTWIIVAFTLERLLMIKNPFKIHTWHNKKPAKFTVIILAIVILGLAIIKSITVPGFENDNMYGYVPCGENYHIQIGVNLVAFLLINNIVSTILITTANICLLIHIRKSAQDRINLNATHDKTFLKVTRMVIIISAVYVILYLPMGITGCIVLFYKKNEPPRGNHALYISWSKNMILLRWIGSITFFIYLLNFVNNFFLYCLSGDIFRQAVKRCLPSYLQKYCPCFNSGSSVSKRIPQRQIALVTLASRDTHRRPLASKKKNFEYKYKF